MKIKIKDTVRNKVTIGRNLTISNLFIFTAPLSTLNMQTIDEGKVKTVNFGDFTVKVPSITIRAFKLLCFILSKAKDSTTISFPVSTITSTIQSLRNVNEYEKTIDSVVKLTYKFFFFQKPQYQELPFEVFDSPYPSKKFYLSVISSFEEKDINEVIPEKRAKNIQRWCYFTLTDEFRYLCKNFEGPIRGYSKIELNYLFSLSTTTEILTYLMSCTTKRYFKSEFLINYFLGVDSNFLKEQTTKDIERIRRRIARTRKEIIEAFEKLKNDGVVPGYTVINEHIRLGKGRTNWLSIEIPQKEKNHEQQRDYSKT